MTEQERAFEAWWAGIGHPMGPEATYKAAFLAGWSRERPRAKPLVVEYKSEAIRGLEYPVGSYHIIRWMNEQGIPDGSKIRVTVEEVRDGE